MSAAITPENFHYLQQHVYAGSGIVLDNGKEYLIEARLMPIVRQMGLTSIDDLCGVLRSPSCGHVQGQVLDAMTTNETFFFREPAHFDALRTVLIPQLATQRQSRRKLSFWSSASSTGQEAFSLVMMLLDLGFGNWDLDILGTDISTAAIDRATKGRYLQIEVSRGLPASSLVKYFRRAGQEWEISEEVRRRVRFRKIDLRERMLGLGPFDAIFCRNVMIYFDNATRRKILTEMRSVLTPGGWLLLGGAETAAGTETLYNRVVHGNAVVYVAKPL